MAQTIVDKAEIIFQALDAKGAEVKKVFVQDEPSAYVPPEKKVEVEEMDEAELTKPPF
jgi:hypothetical protein